MFLSTACATGAMVAISPVVRPPGTVAVAAAVERVAVSPTVESRAASDMPPYRSPRQSPPRRPLQRYVAVTPACLPLSMRPRIRRARPPGIGVDWRVVAPQTVARRLQLSFGADSRYDNRELRSVIRYFRGCPSHNREDEQQVPVSGWARLRAISISDAAGELAGIRSILAEDFFDTAPDAREARWQMLTTDEKILLNLAAGIFDMVGAMTPPSVPTAQQGQAPNQQRMALDADLCAALARALSAPPDLRFPHTESAYTLALAMALNKLAWENKNFTHDRVAILPADLLKFVGPAASWRIASGATAEYAAQRQDHLAALAYSRMVVRSCASDTGSAVPLSALRRQFGIALEKEKRDESIMANMFRLPAATAPGARSTVVHHRGGALLNAKGMDVADLVRHLDTRPSADSAFQALESLQKTRLVRIKLVRLGESPDYRVGSVQQTMASILIRLSDRPEGNRYRRYHSDRDLFEKWESKYRQWLDERDYALSPEMFSAVHMMASNNLHFSLLNWYRDIWKQHILDPLENMPAMRAATPAQQSALWHWLGRQCAGWSPTSRRWQPLSAEQFVASMTGALEAFYMIRQSRPIQRVRHGLIGGEYTYYHDSLASLSDPLQHAVTVFAQAFDKDILHAEHILFDDWLATSYRVHDDFHYRTMLEMQPQPSYSVEVEAYLALLAAGIGSAEMAQATARVLCPVDLNPYHRRLRPVHEAFIAVIRNPHFDAKLLLPNGKLIQPHAIIDKSFTRYRDNLTGNSWVIGRAMQNLRDRAIPLFPRLLEAEIAAVAAPFRAKATKATASGTQLADDFFGALPVSAPMLHLSRAVRAERYTDVPYYALVLVRDLMAVAAMINAFGAAYVGPVMAASRYGAAAMQAGGALSVRRYSRLREDMPDTTYGAAARSRLRLPTSSRKVTLSNDQVHNLQNKIIRQTNQNRAAQQYSAPSADGDDVAYPRPRFDPALWGQMRKMLLPSNQEELELQQQKIISAITDIENAMSELIVDEGAGDTGMLGLGGLTAGTLCDGQRLDRRSTVQVVHNWRIKTVCVIRRTIEDLLAAHVEIVVAANVPPTWSASPAQRHDPLALLANAYRKSPQFRHLMQWYEDHAIEYGALKIHIDAALARAAVTRPAGTTEIRIALPADPARLPFIMDEGGIARQSIGAATLEGVIAAIIETLPPADPMRERGAVIWLANQVQLETGAQFVPRINAALYNASDAMHQATARDIAEQEDQYLERLVPAQMTPPPPQTLFQGENVAERPTVAAVVAVLARIGYPAYLNGMEDAEAAVDLDAGIDAGPVFDTLPNAALDATFNATLDVSGATGSEAEFRHRFDAMFEILPGNRDRVDVAAIHTTLFECYAGSSLFRTLFRYGTGAMRQRWTIYPNGFDPGASFQFDRLFPYSGLIDATTRDAVYLGLSESMPAADSAAGREAGPATIPMEPARRLMDGVVGALSRHGADHFDADPSIHRGATVWLTDLILWQAKKIANKRLAAILLPDVATEKLAQLSAQAGSNRRAARAEDACVMRWLSAQRKESVNMQGVARTTP